MRNKETILKQSERFETDGPNDSPHAGRVQTTLLIETLCDIRDLLQKLVEKKSRKVISTEVSMSDSEQKLLDGLDEIQA